MKTWRIGLALLALWGASAALAAPFEVAINPSRFELAGKSGQRIGQSLEINNLNPQATEVALRTLDWSLSDDGQLALYDALQPGSCRPWVVLERPRVTVPGRGKRSFRFQVQVPPDAGRGECRFMIAVEGVEPAQQAVVPADGGASVRLPVTGRIAVAVYLALNGAQPRLELLQLGVREVNGQRQPFASVRNQGDAHGRLGGALDATDAQGRTLTLDADGAPVLPGQTRTLALLPRGDDGQPAPGLRYPLKAKGLLDWDQGGFRVDTELR